MEKRSSDGSWKRQRFAIRKNKLYYGERASLDLLDVKKVERVGPRLLLWLDDTRKHQLRAADDGPPLDDWERAIQRVRRRDYEARSHSIPEEDEIDHDFYRSQIIEFYQRHNPAKLDDVDTLIAKYRDIGINESELLLAIRNKYKS